eukprot:scaffold24508_cov66-Phaeocystis_antarctica.AAC.3
MPRKYGAADTLAHTAPAALGGGSRSQSAAPPSPNAFHSFAALTLHLPLTRRHPRWLGPNFIAARKAQRAEAAWVSHAVGRRLTLCASQAARLSLESWSPENAGQGLSVVRLSCRGSLVSGATF